MASAELAALAGQVLLGKASLSGRPADEQRALLAFLTAGKLPLFSAGTAALHGRSSLIFPALQTEALSADLEHAREACDRQRRAFVAAQAALAAVEIPVLLVKSSGPYPYTSSNVDALIPTGTLSRAVEALEQDGHHEMTHYWEPNKRLLRKFKGQDCEVMVHLHESISWIVLAFMDLNAVWSRSTRTQDPEVLHPAPEHLVAALLAHSVHESNRVSLGDLWKVRDAVSRPGFDWREVTRIARLRAWLPGLAFARFWYAAAESRVFGSSLLDDPRFLETLPEVPRSIRGAVERAAGSEGASVSLSKAFTRPYFFRRLLADRSHSVRRKVLDLVGVWRQIFWGRLGLRARPASFVCICGIDGSGKSTQAEAVRAALQECELPCRAVWMRGGYSPAAEWLKRWLRRSSSRVPGVGDIEGKTRTYRSGFSSFAWAWLVALEQVFQALSAVRLPLARGHTLVAERFIPDSEADLTERFDDPLFSRRWPARFMQRLTPKPDLILFLDLPGEIAHRRKPDDFDPEILENRRRSYREALSTYENVEILDGCRPLEELRHEVVNRVLALCLGRIRERNPLARQRRDLWR